MGFFDWFKAKKRCKVCSRTSDQVAAAKRREGMVPVPPLIGVCPKCEKAYCVDHAPYDGSIEIDAMVCPRHRNVALTDG